MTVKELIRQLEQYDPDKTVLINYLYFPEIIEEEDDNSVYIGEDYTRGFDDK